MASSQAGKTSGYDGIEQLVQGLIDPTFGGDRFELMSAAIDDAAWVDFTEIRPALEMAQFDILAASPGAALTPLEIDTITFVGGRDYEAFFTKFKDSVLAGLWGYLQAKSTPVGTPGLGSPYSVVETDVANFIIYVKRLDATGQLLQVTSTLNARSAADTLLLYLTAESLADFADIYFSIQNLSSADAYFLREQFFSAIRRFWFENSETSGSTAGSVTTDLHKQQALTALAAAATIYPNYVQSLEGLWGNLRQLLIDRFGEGGEDLGALIDQYTFRPGTAPLWWPFATTPANEINLGLRLVYRQEWRHLGNQRGEVVRTVPLGPKQVERVSTKIFRRSKVARTAEDLKSVERTTERSDSTKNSSEVVEEASQAMKWHLNQEVEGGISVGIYSLNAKTEGGMEQESHDSSKETSSRLTETMQKVASKIRNETRVVVSTEAEATFESTSSSEIQNPNDEIAVTYVYSKLQNQYEVLTRLAEIQNVVMVAEKLPSPADIDFDWVKRHDWIIAKALLDDSFRDALSSISQEARSPDSRTLVTDLHGARDKTIEHLGTLAATPNTRADGIDVVVESQKAYRESAKEQLQDLKLNFEMDAKRHRLYEHIRANILHYQRAIWQQEDPQQRQLRYKKLGKKVPLDWRFEPLVGDSMTIEQFEATLLDGASSGTLDGRFVAYSEGPEVSLDQLINPAGPIGYFGNCAVYYMRPEFASEAIFSMLHFFKSPYLDIDPESGQAEVMDPVQIRFTEANPPAAVTDQAVDDVRDEMFRSVPDLRLALARAQWQDDGDPNSTEATKLLADRARRKACYAEFLFRREQSRRFVVDTNSLVMDILPGDGSALEQFKRIHRGIDALKALQEKELLAREVDRRVELLKDKDFRDPDVERVVVVDHGASGTGSAVAAATAAQPRSGSATSTVGTP